MTPRSSQACWSAGGRNAPDDTNSRRPPPSCAWTRRNMSRRSAYGRCRAIRRRRSNVVARPDLLDLALDRAPEQVEDLRHDDHRGRPVVADRLEDHPRVAAPDVEDVGADVERVEQPDRLLEQVRQRQQRDDPVLHRRDDPVHRPDRGEDVVVGEHHALRRAGRARREDELEDVGRGRAAARRRPAPPSRPGSVSSGSAVSASRRVVGNASRPASRGSGASRPVPRIRCFALGAGGDPLDRVGRHPQVERDEDEARPHRPEVGGGQLRRRRATRSGSGRPARARRPGAARRRAGSAGRARDRSSAMLDPSSSSSPSAGRSPNRATASSSRSSRVAGTLMPCDASAGGECGVRIAALWSAHAELESCRSPFDPRSGARLCSASLSTGSPRAWDEGRGASSRLAASTTRDIETTA